MVELCRLRSQFVGALLVALPLTFAVRLHGISLVGKYVLLFSLVITWIGDSAAYFVAVRLAAIRSRHT